MVRRDHLSLAIALVRGFMAEADPAALRETAARLAEVLERGLWKPKSNSASLLLAEIAGDTHAH